MSTWIFTALVFVISFRWAARGPASLLRALAWLLAAILALWTVQVGTGLFRAIASGAEGSHSVSIEEMHQKAGHAIFVLCWSATMIGTASILGFATQGRARLAIVNGLAGSCVLFLALLATWTGYLRPRAGAVNEETHTRFLILHQGLFPMLLAVVLVAWLLAVGRQRRALREELQSAEGRAESIENQPI